MRNVGLGRVTVAVSVIILLIGMVSGCSGGSSNSSYELHGTVYIKPADQQDIINEIPEDWSADKFGKVLDGKLPAKCFGLGTSKYKDGAQVNLTDGSGNTVGVATLDGGKFAASKKGRIGGCTFTFDANVKSADFYKIDVAGSSPVTFSLKEMKSKGWKVHLDIS